MARNYAEQLVDTLEKQGVERIYGLVGDSLNPVSYTHLRAHET